MNDQEAIPIHKPDFSLGFIVISVLSGCFTFVVFFHLGTVVITDVQRNPQT